MYTNLYEKIVEGKEKISLVGLGYVGMPIAIEFAKRGIEVIGYDLNANKIETYKSGIDPTNEVGNNAIKTTTVEFTADEKDLSRAKFHIVWQYLPQSNERSYPKLNACSGGFSNFGT